MCELVHMCTLVVKGTTFEATLLRLTVAISRLTDSVRYPWRELCTFKAQSSLAGLDWLEVKPSSFKEATL